MPKRASEETSGPRAVRSTARRLAFIEAAHQVFTAQGYGAAGMGDVVRIAGGSLRTLYAQFGNKEGLFLAMVEERLHQSLPRLEVVLSENWPVEQGLQYIGEVYLLSLLQPDWLALFRIVVGEGRAYPQLMQRFGFRALQLTRGITGQFLQKRILAGDARPMNADQTAAFFIEMLRAHHHMAALSDPNYKVVKAELSAHVASAVDLICAGIRPRQRQVAVRKRGVVRPRKVVAD